MQIKKLIRQDILYPELSYQIIGILFEVSNAMGPKYQERYYQKAVAELLNKANIKFIEQFPVDFILNEKIISKGLMDFFIEDKIALELKKGERFLKSNIDQLYSYIKIANLKLGILANFNSKGLQFKRIVNINS